MGMTIPTYNFEALRGDTILLTFTANPLTPPSAGDTIRCQVRDRNDVLVIDLTSTNGSEISWSTYGSPVTGINVIVRITPYQSSLLTADLYKYSVTVTYNSTSPVTQTTILTGALRPVYNAVHGDYTASPLWLSGANLAACGEALATLSDLDQTNTWTDGTNVYTKFGALTSLMYLQNDFGGGTLHLSALPATTSVFACPSPGVGMSNLKAIQGADALPATCTALLLVSSGAEANPEFTSLALGTPPAAMTGIVVKAFDALTSITMADSWPVQNTDFSGNALSQTCVDAILAACVASAATDHFLDLSGGTNAAPSIDSTDVATLLSRGWTVHVNGVA